MTGRAKQKMRTRTALLQAAGELVREGRRPSMPEAADRALVSVATAYRYFSTAEDLWWEASHDAFGSGAMLAEVEAQVEASGPDPQARVQTLVRAIGFRMLDDQVPFRRIAKGALEQWFRQADAPPSRRVPTREGRRNEQIRHAVAPLVGHLSDPDIDRLAHALGLIVGTEAMISLTDAVGLDVPTAKETLLDAARWMVSGALAELSSGRDEKDGAAEATPS